MFNPLCRLALSVAVLTLLSAAAPRGPDRMKIERAKDEIRAVGYTALGKTFDELPPESRAALGDTELRGAGLYMAIAASLATCRRYARPADVEAWQDYFDRLHLGQGQFGPGVQAILRKAGEDVRSAPLDQELPPAQARGFCSVELQAVRELLADR